MSSQLAPSDYDALYRAHSKRMLGLIGRRIGRSEAEDIVQESFLRLLGIQQSGKSVVEQPGHYLTVIALNLLKDRARRVVRHPTTPIDEDFPPLRGPNIEAGLEARDMLDRVSVTLSRLAPATRNVFVARRVYGHSYSEIASRTGLSFKGIEHHMAKAIARVEKGLARPPVRITPDTGNLQTEHPIPPNSAWGCKPTDPRPIHTSPHIAH